MIEINLLPEDLKRAPRQSHHRRTAIMAAALAVALAIGLAYFHVAHVAPRRAQSTALAACLADLKKKTAKLAEVQTEIKHVEKRKRALAALYDERLIWSRKLDQLIDVVPPNIWLKSIKVGAARTRRDGAAGILSLECYSTGSELKGVTLFRERITADQAFDRDFGAMNRINTQEREFPEYVEGKALEFRLDLPVKSRQAPAAPASDARRTRTAQAPQ